MVVSMKSINKTILAASVVMAVFCLNLSAQEGKCPNFKIGVYLNSIFAADTTAGYLNETQNRHNSASEWKDIIESYILEKLNEAGYDGLEFFIADPSSGEEMDLEFRFSLYPWSVDGEEKLPGYEVKYVDPVTGWEVIEYRAPVYEEQTAFLMFSALVVCSPCIPLMTYFISIEKAVGTDIFQLIKDLLFYYNFPLDLNIQRWEEKHPAPARGPKMEIRYERKFLSLLDEESRKTEVYIKVKNCHGVYVYQKDHGQPVYFLKEIERLEYKDDPRNKCQVGMDWGIFSTVFTNSEYEAIGQYKVINGLAPSVEKPVFKTCGIGNSTLIEMEGQIVVRGLELLVEPWRTTIHNGEQTKISVDLHEIDPDGFKFPAVDQEVEIRVTGLVDGAVSPEGKVTTDGMGVAWIDYKAGKEDKQIKITATFTPPGYSEKVTADATITVKPLEYDATLTLNGSYRKTEESHSKTKNSWGDNENTLEAEEYREASFYIPLKMVNAYDVEVQNLRYEYYQPLDINLSNFNASFRSTEYSSSIAPDQGSKTTIIRKKTASDRKISIKEILLQNNIVMTLDLKTGKVLKIDLDGFPVEFTWNETIDIHKESWWQPPPQPGHETKDDRQSSKSDDSFQVGPVEDPVPDPTIKNSTEQIMNYLKEMGITLPAEAEAAGKEEVPGIEPDLLVKHGDGKTWFGGEGSKIINNSEGSTVYREEFSFSWQATRKKKPL